MGLEPGTSRSSARRANLCAIMSSLHDDVLKKKKKFFPSIKLHHPRGWVMSARACRWKLFLRGKERCFIFPFEWWCFINLLKQVVLKRTQSVYAKPFDNQSGFSPHQTWHCFQLVVFGCARMSLSAQSSPSGTHIAIFHILSVTTKL